MEVSGEQQRSIKFTAGIRVCALMLALLMIVTTVFGVLVRVKPAGAAFVSEETAQRAFNAIAEQDEYLSAPAFERVRMLLRSLTNRQDYTAEEYENVASIYIGRENYEEALYLYDQCIAKSKTREGKTVLATRYLKRGSLNVLSGNLDEAIDDYNTVLSFVPNASTARLLLAQVYIEKKDYTTAAEQMSKYVAITPDDAENRAMYAAILENAGDFDAAYEQYSILAQSDGDNMELSTSLVRTALQSGRYDETVARLTFEIADKGDTDGTRHFLRGIAMLWNEEYADAEADFQMAIDLGYADAVTCYKQLSLCAYVQKNYESSISYGKKAEELWQKVEADGECLQRVGLSAMQLGDYETALSYLKLSLEAAPELTDSNYYIATLYLVDESYSEALTYYSAAIEAGYMLQECYYNRAICRLQTEDYQGAREDLELSISSGGDESIAAGAEDILSQLERQGK